MSEKEQYWIYILDYADNDIYEIELSADEYDTETDSDDENLIRKLGFNYDEVSWMYSPYRLTLNTELLKDR